LGPNLAEEEQHCKKNGLPFLLNLEVTEWGKWQI
jgi:hypothetical protein